MFCVESSSDLGIPLFCEVLRCYYFFSLLSFYRAVVLMPSDTPVLFVVGRIKAKHGSRTHRSPPQVRKIINEMILLLLPLLQLLLILLLLIPIPVIMLMIMIII